MKISFILFISVFIILILASGDEWIKITIKIGAYAFVLLLILGVILSLLSSAI